MTDTEIIALAWRYYNAGRASTAKSDGVPTRDEAIARFLVLAIRIGQVARQSNTTGTGRAKTVERPPLLTVVVDNVVGLTGDRGKAAELVDSAFVKGYRKRYTNVLGWTKPPQPSAEERHSWTLLTTEPTSYDDGGVRKARQRATEWFRKQGRVID